MTKKLNTYYISGASICFTDENDSAFISSVLPSGDQYDKKEIIAIVDNEKMKKGLFGGNVKSEDVLEKFTQWGANPEDINKMSDFLNSNLTKKELKEQKKTYKGNISDKGVGGEYSKEEKY